MSLPGALLKCGQSEAKLQKEAEDQLQQQAGSIGSLAGQKWLKRAW